ncbi:CBS domain-containing protein [Candidatus Micrarchaeota archaeon]|nr:CBS domain-containing protein [Candidatus Micrarchaeota archaeon]
MGSDLKVGDIMTKKVIIIPYGKNMQEVAKLMKKSEIGSVIVVEDTASKKARGIITERDIMQKVLAKGKDPYKTVVEEIMSKPLRVIKPDTSIEEAANAMRDNRIKRLPVVDEENELIGIISEGDIMKIFPLVIDLIEEKASVR